MSKKAAWGLRLNGTFYSAKAWGFGFGFSSGFGALVEGELVEVLLAINR